MITELTIWSYQTGVAVNFIAHMLTFSGTFYVALHNRSLPQWHVTPLWYVGLCSLLNAVTILVLWGIGPEHPLSYWNIGHLTEMISNLAVSSIAFVMLLGTAVKDFKESKKRQNRAK